MRHTQTMRPSVLPIVFTGRAALCVAALVACLAAPYVVYPIFLMKVLCFGLFAAAFNLLIGYVGLLSFGHAAFFGGAAYVTAYAMKTWGVTPEVGVLLGAVSAGLLGLVFGVVAIRRQGIYFAMITLALAQMFYFFCVQAPFTGGEDGIQNVPRGRLFGVVDLEGTLPIYYFVLVVVVMCFLGVQRIVESPFGNILKAIRDNEPRMISLGYGVQRYKVAAFVMSATMAGLAGSLKALVFQMATLVDVEWHTSGQVVMMTLLGGISTLLGPIVGSGIVVTLQNVLATSTMPVSVVSGVIFVICVMLFRRGVVGELEFWLERRRAVRGR